MGSIPASPTTSKLAHLRFIKGEPSSPTSHPEHSTKQFHPERSRTGPAFAFPKLYPTHQNGCPRSLALGDLGSHEPKSTGPLSGHESTRAANCPKGVWASAPVGALLLARRAPNPPWPTIGAEREPAFAFPKLYPTHHNGCPRSLALGDLGQHEPKSTGLASGHELTRAANRFKSVWASAPVGALLLARRAPNPPRRPTLSLPRHLAPPCFSRRSRASRCRL